MAVSRGEVWLDLKTLRPGAYDEARTRLIAELLYEELGSLPRGYVQLVECARRKGFAVAKVRAPDSYPVFFTEALKTRGSPDDAPRCRSCLTSSRP